MLRSSASFALVATSLVLLAGVPGAQADARDADGLVRSVGAFAVDAQGRALGENVVAQVVEADGTVRGFRSSAMDLEIFSNVRIDGFAQAEKIEGVGSSNLVLRGTNAILSLHDNLNCILELRATQPTTITWRLAPGVTAGSGSQDIVHLSSASKGRVGSIVALDGKGLSVEGSQVVARAEAGARFVFFAMPSPDARPTHDALAQAAASGILASHFVTELAGSSVASSQADLAKAGVRTSAAARGAIETSVRYGQVASQVLSYDLAYETLPAQRAEDVSVHADGQLLARAESAQRVVANARANVASYFAEVQDGRARVLVSTPDFDGAFERRIVVGAHAQASTESQARAEQSAEDERVYGGFEYHANGKLTGDFVTGVVPEGQPALLGFTALASRAEVFRSVTLDGEGSARLEADGPQRVALRAPKADLVLVDDAYATLLVVAKAPAQASFALASDVRARADRADVLVLEGPAGPAGTLILLAGESEGSRLATDAQGRIVATLDAGARVAYRGPSAHLSERGVARAIADGLVGAQALAGSHEGARATHATEYAHGAEASIRAQGEGAIAFEYLLPTDAAQSVLIDARGAALAAKAADDVTVLVDGAPALLEAGALAVLEPSAQARYHVETGADGALRILVNTGKGAGEQASILVESRVAQAARAASRADAFGSFRVFHDGRAVGDHVTLRVDKAAGAVSGLAAGGVPLFASLSAGASAFASAGADGASVLTLQNRETRIDVLDSTNGFLKVLATQDADVALRLAPGLRAEERGPQVLALVAADGEHVASLVLSGAGTLAARGEESVVARLDAGAQLLFRTHAGIESELSAAQRQMMNEALAAGAIAGQVTVETEARASRSVTMGYGVVDVVTAATAERVEITLDSTQEAGKTLLVSLDPATVSGMARGKARILFDGEPAKEASSFADVLDASDDAGAAEYLVLAGDAGIQVLVSVPHFSVHTVTLEEQVDHPDQLYLYATVVLGAVVVIESAILARRSRRKRT